MSSTLAETRSIKTGAFVSPSHKRRWASIMVVLAALAVLLSAGVLLWNNPMPFGSEGFWKIAQSRINSIVVIALVVTAHGFATVTFQTVTANRIITPSIMGFEALYIAVQTAIVFFFGITGVTLSRGMPQFLLQTLLMVGLATALYGWLLSGRFANIHIMLLVGVVIGGGLGSLSTFMQRMLDPNEFDVLTARLFGNISNARIEYLPFVIPVVIAIAVVLIVMSRRLDLLSMGQFTCTNLGLNHRTNVIGMLVLVSVLMAMTTSLVGPMTFLGFLMATVAYSVTDTYDHRIIFPTAVLIGYVLLTGSYFILRHVFPAQGAVTVIVELIGGLVFLTVIMRKRRL